MKEKSIVPQSYHQGEPVLKFSTDIKHTVFLFKNGTMLYILFYDFVLKNE